MDDDTESINDATEALMIDVGFSSPSPLDQDNVNTDTFITSFGTIHSAKIITTDLANRSFDHAITGSNPDLKRYESDPFTYITSERYTSDEFYGIMIDTGASKRSTAGYGQYLAYKKNVTPIQVDKAKAGAVNVQFGIGSTSSIGSLLLDTPIGIIEFHVVEADTPFLLCLEDMDNLNVYFNNLENVLITSTKSVPVVRRFGHPFLLWDKSLQSFIANSFNNNPCFLTDTELRQLHRRFGHPSAGKLHKVLERAGHETDKKIVDNLTKYCMHCQKHGKSPGRFKFTLKEDANFNYSILVDIMYIDGSPILHVVDEATRFQAARWLNNVSAKHTWETLRLCWIDVYIGPPDLITHDAGSNFVSKEFCQYATSMAIATKSVPVEAHWSIGMVERYHAVLRRAYKVIADDLQGCGLSKEIILQMAVKAINDTAGPNGLVPTLLVFGAYPRMSEFDSPTPTITQRATAIKNAMKEVRKVRAERQVADALNQRNGPGPMVSVVHDLPLDSDVLVWREGNVGHSGKWTGPYKLLAIENETCKVQLPSGPTNFRITTVKPYLHEHPYTEIPPLPDLADSKSDSVQSAKEDTNDDNGDDIDAAKLPRRNPARAYRLPTRFQHMADISVFLKNDASGPPFTESRRKEINGLLEKGAFEVISISDVPSGMRIFNSRFVDEIKNEGTATAFEKSRLVVQAYNDHGKEEILTQSPTIQRMSQRLILALAACMPQYDLYLRDISQAYVQSTTHLNREFFVRPPVELGLPSNAILKIIKPLYGVPEAGNHWFNTYHSHHREKLSMTQSTYDPCLLYTENSSSSGFGIVGLQTDDTLFLADKMFAVKEEEQLHKANLLAKEREKLDNETIKFNK